MIMINKFIVLLGVTFTALLLLGSWNSYKQFTLQKHQAELLQQQLDEKNRGMEELFQLPESSILPIEENLRLCQRRLDQYYIWSNIPWKITIESKDKNDSSGFIEESHWPGVRQVEMKLSIGPVKGWSRFYQMFGLIDRLQEEFPMRVVFMEIAKEYIQVQMELYGL